MPRLKTLSILAGIIAALAISATPASAWWKSTLGQTQGPVKILKSGKFVDRGTTVECPKEEIKAQWYLQTKGQIKEHQTNGKQEPTAEGPHLNIQVKWGKELGCKTKINGVEGALETTVKPCELQLVQQKRVMTATGGVVTGCVIKAAGVCELQVPAGMEKQPGSNEGINVGLKAITLENNQGLGNQIDKVNVSTGGIGQLAGEGIFVVQNPGHALCPVPTNEEAELLELEFEAEKIQAV